jgi:hypothetical protein
MIEKRIHFSIMWNRYLIGIHWIRPSGSLFWSVWLGPLKISYDYKPNYLEK